MDQIQHSDFHQEKAYGHYFADFTQRESVNVLFKVINELIETTNELKESNQEKTKTIELLSNYIIDNVQHILPKKKNKKI